MIKIICVGKIKEQYIKEAITDYYNRIKKYTKIEIIEVMDEKIEEEKTTKKKEGQRIFKHIKDKDYVVVLDILGKQYTSIEFAKFMNDTCIISSNIVFIIGGSLGLEDTVKERANICISFSKFTFPHQLFRVLLLEQIYRSYKINNNENYHK